MLRRDFVSEYLNDFIEVSNDVVAKINNSNSAKQPYYHDIEDTLFHWSLQCKYMILIINQKTFLLLPLPILPSSQSYHLLLFQP